MVKATPTVTTHHNGLKQTAPATNFFNQVTTILVEKKHVFVEGQNFVNTLSSNFTLAALNEKLEGTKNHDKNAPMLFIVPGWQKLQEAIDVEGCKVKELYAGAIAAALAAGKKPAAGNYSKIVPYFTGEVKNSVAYMTEEGTFKSNIPACAAQQDCPLLYDDTTELFAKDPPEGFPKKVKVAYCSATHYIFPKTGTPYEDYLFMLCTKDKSIVRVLDSAGRIISLKIGSKVIALPGSTTLIYAQQLDDRAEKLQQDAAAVKSATTFAPLVMSSSSSSVMTKERHMANVKNKKEASKVDPFTAALMTSDVLNHTLASTTLNGAELTDDAKKVKEQVLSTTVETFGTEIVSRSRELEDGTTRLRFNLHNNALKCLDACVTARNSKVCDLLLNILGPAFPDTPLAVEQGCEIISYLNRQVPYKSNSCNSLFSKKFMARLNDPNNYELDTENAFGTLACVEDLEQGILTVVGSLKYNPARNDPVAEKAHFLFNFIGYHTIVGNIIKVTPIKHLNVTPHLLKAIGSAAPLAGAAFDATASGRALYNAALAAPGDRPWADWNVHIPEAEARAQMVDAPVTAAVTTASSAATRSSTTQKSSADQIAEDHALAQVFEDAEAFDHRHSNSGRGYDSHDGGRNKSRSDRNGRGGGRGGGSRGRGGRGGQNSGGRGGRNNNYDNSSTEDGMRSGVFNKYVRALQQGATSTNGGQMSRKEATRIVHTYRAARRNGEKPKNPLRVYNVAPIPSASTTKTAGERRARSTGDGGFKVKKEEEDEF